MSTSTTFVLVPGGGGSPWVWSRLVPAIRRRGHEAVAVDLPGPDPLVDLHGYVDRVVAEVRATRESALGPVALVGLSLGGFSASAAALVEPVDHLVLVNAMVPRPGESPAQWWRTCGQSRERRANERAAGRDPERPFDPLEVFLHDAAPEVLAEAAEHERDEADAAFATPWPGTRWPQVPTSVVVADDDRLFPPSMQTRVAADRLGLPTHPVPGGHLCPLTRPVELADLLTRLVGPDGTLARTP